MSLVFLLLGLLSGTARAGSAVAFIEISDDGPALVDLVGISAEGPRKAPAAPVDAGAWLEVLDAEGRTLARVPVPDARQRSVILPEGGGASVTLAAAIAPVTFAWPDGATHVRLGAQTLAPRAAPPTTPVPVQESGPSDARLDMVFLGDGYTEAELPDFAADVDRMVAYLLSIEPYGAYTGLFNIWRVDAASAESGASHRENGQDVSRDTAYGCYYGCGNIARLVCCQDSAVMAEVRASVPDADGVLVLINDDTYGGAGGFSYATAYTGGAYDTQVAAHELGHSLIGLWDEYSYGYAANGEGPNCTADSGGATWTQWLDEREVGAYPVCSYTNLFRPTDASCMMNTLQDDYCPVCREQAVLGIYGRLPSLLVAAEPAPGAVTVDAAQTFTATALGPDDGSLTWRWTLDGALLSETDAVTLEGCGPSGALTLEVADPTPWVRLDPDGLLTDAATWEVTRAPCGADDSGADSDDADDSGGGGISPKGCGCGSVGGAGALWLAGLVFAVRRRRVDSPR
ncbi:MAG: hypothetical protein H6739_03495 [Alphaproteobacteria bacterium]|nr:hypothetical protein [Alphaproteobacteria bacterium]